MVEYLNAMSGPATSIIAVSYSRMKDQGTEILMPRIYGEELAEAKSAPHAGRQTTWSVDTYRSWLASNSPSSLDKFEHFLAHAAAAGLSFHGSTTIVPTGTFGIFDRDNTRLGTVSLISYTSKNTSLELDFYRASRLEPQQVAAIAGLSSLPARIAAIPGMEEAGILMSSSGFANRKNTLLSELTDESIRQLVEVLAALRL
ncbi:hypothetical protein IV500_18655 [Paeniglutamicibacter antarcticus]|uniref:Uncharacterized protein n=1 Tax=Arthrobacter terrae TaxID=2935737 RepID=A0A931GC48_9MICC|nr:hypothetical protein [Arthrobacter terrae]MBG0741387.1 hypothetical protein [Arthrobacter terrae]